MNIALLATRANKQELEAFVKSAAVMQEEVVNGAIMVVYADNLSRENAEELVAPLKKVFKAVATLEVKVNNNRSNDMQVASLFARFLVSGYSKFPGAWLMVDSESYVIKKNFMDVAQRQHGDNVIAGKFQKESGRATPVGPVSLSENGMKLKFLRYTTNQTWRQRGQYHFARCKHYDIPAEDYCFSINVPQGIVAETKEEIVEQKKEVKTEPSDTASQESDNTDISIPEAIKAEEIKVEVVFPVPVIPVNPPAPSEYIDSLNKKIQQGTQGDEITAAKRKEFLEQGLESITPIALITPKKQAAKKVAKKVGKRGFKPSLT